MQLRMKICSKTSAIKRVEVIGEINVMLDSFDLLRETRLWKDLEPQVKGEVSFFLKKTVLIVLKKCKTLQLYWNTV